MGQNIIELNGKRYDAVTGAFLGHAGTKPHVPGTPISQRGRVIDGFIRKPQATGATTVVKPVAPTTHHPKASTPAPHASKTTEPVKKVTRKAGPTVKHVQPHHPERPKTLMRHVVHKPHVSMKPAIKTQATAGIAARPVSEIAIPLEKKLSVTQVDPVRLARAQHVAKSHHIRRFAAQPRHAATAQVAVMPVRQAPGVTQQHQAQQVAPVSAAAAPARSARANSVAARPVRAQIAAVRQPAPARTTPKNEEPVDVFEAAIAHARSHEHPSPKVSRRSNRILNWAAGFGAFLLIASFVAYLNMNTIELRIASVRAGFTAEMPSYQPTGYALGPIKAQKGKVSLGFQSGESTYRITQETSDWDSQTLYDNYVSAIGSNPETVESKGRTIYIYNENNATWVNGGVRYEISGNNASLSSDELVAMATSM